MPLLYIIHKKSEFWLKVPQIVFVAVRLVQVRRLHFAIATMPLGQTSILFFTRVKRGGYGQQCQPAFDYQLALPSAI